MENDRLMKRYFQQTALTIPSHDKNHITGETILRADCTESNESDCWEAIHIAALNSVKEKLYTLLRLVSSEQVNSLVHSSEWITTKLGCNPNKKVTATYSNNALHILLKYGKRNQQFLECCKLLIEKGVNVNHADSNGVTPLDLMKKEEKLTDIYQRNQNTTNQNTSKSTFFDLIKNNYEEQFISRILTEKEANGVDGSTVYFSSCTLLQLCCFKGLTSCVQHLLNHGACPNKTIPKNKYCPIMIAIKGDHEDIVKLLLADSKIVLPDNILLELQMKYEMDNERIDKYMRLILEHLEKLGKSNIKNYLTACDSSGRTALHYAALHKSSTDNTVKLVELGASLTKKDKNGNTPLNEIDPIVLETFFDNCINVPKGVQGMSNMLSHKLQIYKNKFYVEIDYDALLPDENEYTGMLEIELLYYLVQTRRLDCLLIHPVIASYLAMKEHKIRWLSVWLNLVLYYAAFLLFSFYPSKINNNSPITAIILMGTALLMVSCRVVGRFFIFSWDYIKKVENVIDLFLTVNMIYIIIAGWRNTKPIETKFENQNLLISMVIGSVAFVLAITLQMKNFPFAAVQISVLKNISKWFFIFMICYLNPLIFCFRLLTSSAETSDNSVVTDIYNIISILAGDPSSSKPYQFLGNRVIGTIISVFFIVFIGILLQNLLIALTVNDLQKFDEEAELTNLKEKAKYLVNLERLLLTCHQSSYKIFKKFFRPLIKGYEVFGKDRVLIFHFYKNGIVYLKEKRKDVVPICNERITDFLLHFVQNSSLNNGENVQHSLNVISDRLQRLENLLEKRDVL